MSLGQTRPKDMPPEMWEPDIHSSNGNSASIEYSNAPGAVGQLLSEVKAERVEWFWPGRIPRGKLTVMDGDPGLGKSALTTDLAARKSAGRTWPDGEECETGGVVICSAEDGLSDTIRPRLDAAGGDPSKVLALATVTDGQGERLISIPEHLHIIERGIERVGAELVIVDPLMAFLSGDTNSHRDQDVRRALAPLAKLAEGTGAAVLVVRHLNKATGGHALYRGGGSIGIIGAARSALLVAKHPEDERRRVLAPLKNNLAPPAPSLMFSLSEASNGAVRVGWMGETHHAADALLATPTDPEERTALEEAREFLRGALSDGPVWSVEIKKDARMAEISEATLRRAKTDLGVRSAKDADGSWSWSLPSVERTQEDEHVEHLDPLGIGKPKNPAQDGEHLEHQGGQGAHGHEQAKAAYLSEGAQGAQGPDDEHPPSEISEVMGVPANTLKNPVTGPRKQGTVEPAGKKEGREEHVRLVVPTSQSLKGDGTRADRSRPLSEDLKPGESATLAELRARRAGISRAAGAREVLSQPPGWLQDQMAHCRKEGCPTNQLGALAAAVAAHLYDDPTKGTEILAEVEALMTHGVGCDCEACL